MSRAGAGSLNTNIFNIPKYTGLSGGIGSNGLGGGIRGGGPGGGVGGGLGRSEVIGAAGAELCSAGEDKGS